MKEYATIESETAMTTPTYRTTPYQFAVTAEPGQFIATYGRIVCGAQVVHVPQNLPGTVVLPDAHALADFQLFGPEPAIDHGANAQL